MTDSSNKDSHPSGNPVKKRAGRPSSGVPRDEQMRRASAARRAGLRQLQLLLPPEIYEALEIASQDHAAGKAGYALQVLAEHLGSKGGYIPPQT